MAAALIGGAFLSASLQVLFDRLASQNVIDFFKGSKLNSMLLKKLEIMMISVEALLDDAEEKQITRRAVRKWLDELKDAVYEADDLLDEIAYAALGSEMDAGPQTSKDRVRNFFSSQGPLEEEIESKLVEILEILEYLVNQKNALGLKEGIGEKPLSQRIPTTSVMDESGVYGREEDKEVIVQLLLSDDANCNNLGLIPIIGMGGVGKTTLAQFVYNDSRVKERFGFKAWISVSEEFDVLKITRDILNGDSSTIHDNISEEFDGSKKATDILNRASSTSNINVDLFQFASKNKTLDHFQVTLKNKLADKKFLLVFDDVWNDKYDHWDILLKPLKAGAKGSKIIITTRLQSVASVMGIVQTHHVKELSDDECWLLFSKHAFDGRGSSANPNLEKIGREIVRKCNGLPLAAKSLGGLLRSKPKPEEWERVLKNDIWNLPGDNILPALRLSYHFLPSHLKQCFAYCAIFPKGYVFRKEELVLLWMGEGFLDKAGSRMEREATGEEYFDDLVSRSFFNPNRDVFLRPGFSMHDLINDLARYVAGEFCFRLDDDDDDSCKVTPRTRHLSCVLRKNLLPSKSKGITSTPLLRTFLPVHLSASRKYGAIDGKVIHETLRKLVHLRVLSLSWYDGLLEIDDSIGNLKHLRHLDLSRTSIKILPESLCSLYHLEILLLVGCFELLELPQQLGNLANLCVLDIEGTRLKMMPPHMGKLTKLQKLSHFMIGDESESGIQELGNLQHLIGELQKLSHFMIGKKSGSSIQELGNLQHLRGGLVIRNLENVMQVEEALRANIKGKIHLKKLELNWQFRLRLFQPFGGVENSPIIGYRPTSLLLELLEQLEPHENVETLTISGYGGTRFPDWIDGGSPLLGVVTLDLHGCSNVCKLPSLGLLEHLKKLSITNFEGIESIGSEFYVSPTSMKKPFRCLEVLRFERMPRWREWVVRGNEGEDFHLLQELYIVDCEEFRHSLPQHLPSLTKLEIRECPSLEASLPRVPSILKMKLDDLTLRDDNWLSAFGCRSPLCERIEQLGRGLLETLQVVRVAGCDLLKCFRSFSNLMHLSIESCVNFERIDGNYTSLISLRIEKCPNLLAFPTRGLEAPNLQTLSLKDCDYLELLEESMHSKLYSLDKLIIGNCSLLKSFPKGGLPLKLQRLEIVNCTGLINRRDQWNLPSLLHFVISGYKHAECFPEDSLLPPTLTSLEIRDFPNLKSLQYKGYQHLTSLQSLTIDNCPQLQLLPEEGLPSSLTSLKIWDLQNLECVVNPKIQQLANLKELSISKCPKLKSVPEKGLSSTITSLTIWDFADLESLDSEGLQNLTSLKELRIYNCPKLHSLPKEGLPSSLSFLHIQDCDLLQKRCEPGKGEDWPKISHISHVYTTEDC